jgi:diacylglycerol kinase (ATP)
MSAARTCVIFNPTARGEKARRFRRHLDEIAAQSALMLTAGVGDARRLASEAVRQGFQRIVAAGGDGTVNEVLNGMADVPGGFEAAALGVLPLGTVNVFAREMGVSLKLQRAWQIICEGRETRLDAPCVDYQVRGAAQRRWFAQLGGAGLDARAIELVSWPLKKKIGPLAYVLAGVNALRDSLPQITAEGGGCSHEGKLVLIGNGKLYGGPYRVFPKADPRDGLLDVCVFPRVGWLTLARCGPWLLLRGALPVGVTRTFQASSVTLTSSGPAAFELDGELVGQLPARFSLERSVLRVLAPGPSS